MRGREGVAHEDIAERGQLAGEIGIVVFFAAMEAGVLQAENIAGAHRIHGRQGFFADAILGECDRPLDHFCQLAGDGLQ